MYEKPNKVIDMYGRNIYAYVTTLNNNNIHKFPELLVLGFSLIRTGSFADRICIVTNDINDEYVKILSLFYTIIRTVDIKIGEHSFIKYLALNLTQYKKVLIINSSFLILQNPDFLFTLNAPAAYFTLNNYISIELLLLTPIPGAFDAIIFEMKHRLIGIDESEYIYNKFYEMHWTHISDSYFYNDVIARDYTNVNYIRLITPTSNMILADINKNDINMLWYEIYKKMLEQYGFLISNPLLSYTNKILTSLMKTYMMRIQEEPEIINDTSILNIKNIYNTNNIHMRLEQYYHIDKTNEIILPDQLPMFDDINSTPIKKLLDKYNNNYYKNLIKYDITTLYDANNIDIYDRDHIMLLYLKSTNNISIDILEKKNIDKYKLDGGLFYVKTLLLNKKTYENLIFFLEDKINYQNRINKIDNSDIQETELTFVFYKKIPENYNKTLQLGELVLNNNSIHLLKNQDIRNIASPFMAQSLLYIHTLRNWINKNFSQLETDRLLLFGDITMNIYGIKNITRIEGVYLSCDTDSSEIDRNIENIIYDTFINEETSFGFIRITKENTTEYNKYHKDLIDKIKLKVGVEKSSELISNPRFFINYLGLKILPFDLNMLYINSQKTIEMQTDIVMTNIVNKHLISRYVSYNNKTKILHTNKDIKLNKNNINRIKQYARTRYIKRYINEL